MTMRVTILSNVGESPEAELMTLLGKITRKN